jgi:hypothetical protein
MLGDTVDELSDYFELYEVPAYFDDDRELVVSLFRNVRLEKSMSVVAFQRFT